MKVNIIPWYDNYVAFFGSLQKGAKDTWTQVIMDNVKCTESDIDRIVAQLCESWRSDNGKPSIRDIMAALYNSKGLGKIQYKQEADIIQRGKALLHKCVRGDFAAMHDVITMDHRAWLIDRAVAVKVWTETISRALEAYAKEYMGYDPEKIQLPDINSLVARTADGMVYEEDEAR